MVRAGKKLHNTKNESVKWVSVCVSRPDVSHSAYKTLAYQVSFPQNPSVIMARIQLRRVVDNVVLSHFSFAGMKTSASMDGSDNKKTRHKLKKFLTRRPTLQSVRDKGYIKGTGEQPAPLRSTDQWKTGLHLEGLNDVRQKPSLFFLSWIESQKAQGGSASPP